MKKPAKKAAANRTAAKPAPKAKGAKAGKAKGMPAGKSKSAVAIAAAAKNIDAARQAEAAALKRKETLTPAERARLLELAPRPADTRWESEIEIGDRHRKDFGDITALARSMNARNGMLSRIAVNARDGKGQDKLIDGERRLRAWLCPTSKFRELPIPVNAVPIDSIARGEWDGNDPALRKDFTPSEMVALKQVLEPELKKAAAERQRAHGGTARGRKAEANAAAGKTRDIVGAIAGRSGRTVEKAEKIVQAAKERPDDARFTRLVDAMDKTGRVNGPFNRLNILLQTEQLRDAPAPLPMCGPYAGMIIDYPWPNEPNMTQEEIDGRGRSLRPYAAMSIEAGLKLFASEEFQKLLAPECVVGFCTTNFHMPYAYQLLQAMGFTLLEIPTILTWDKVKIGRGQVLRDRTEHVLIAIRGKPVINLTNETTLITESRRGNSVKPEKLYKLFETVFPATRYADIFSGGGRGEKWDCHGEPGRMAAGEARAAAEEVADVVAPPVVADPGRFVQGDLRQALERTEQGLGVVVDFDLTAAGFRQYVSGARKLKLNKAGKAKLAEMRAAHPDQPAAPADNVAASLDDVTLPPVPATAANAGTVLQFPQREEGAA